MPIRKASSRLTQVADAMTTRPVLASTAMTDHVALAVDGRQRSAMTSARNSLISTSLVKRRRVDPELAQIHVTLAAMMNLVVHDIEKKIVDRHLPLSEGLVGFLETGGRNRRPQLVDLGGRVIPHREDVGFRGGLRHRERF